MSERVMLEVTQPVVDGNTVVIAAGTLYEPDAELPEGVTVRKVVADVPDKPAPKAESKSESKSAAEGSTSRGAHARKPA